MSFASLWVTAETVSLGIAVAVCGLSLAAFVFRNRCFFRLALVGWMQFDNCQDVVWCSRNVSLCSLFWHRPPHRAEAFSGAGVRPWPALFRGGLSDLA